MGSSVIGGRVVSTSLAVRVGCWEITGVEVGKRFSGISMGAAGEVDPRRVPPAGRSGVAGLQAAPRSTEIIKA
jgi:hypothetical protein